MVISFKIMRVIYIFIILSLLFFALFQSRIQSTFITPVEPPTREESESTKPTPDASGPTRGTSAQGAHSRAGKSDPTQPSMEDLGLFLESHGLPRILAKEAWVYGKTIHAVMETGNEPRSGALATDHALTSWSNICVMRLTRKYRLEPEVVGQFFAVIQSNNPALKP